MRNIALFPASVLILLACLVSVGAQPATRQAKQGAQPLTMLAGEWRVTYLVMGGGIATFGNCEQTKIIPAADNSIGLALESLPCPHETVKSWKFVLKPTPDKKGYLLTLKGGYGPSVENQAVDYSGELGWHAKLPNNEQGNAVEAAISPMKEGGWQIYVGSPPETKLDAIPKPEMKVYLNPIKK